MPTGKFIVTTAAISLLVVLAHQHVAANGLPKAGRAHVGN